MSHRKAFLNALIGKLFSEATINYSDSSTLQPLKETVQSLSRGRCLLCTWSPLPPGAVLLWVIHAGGLWDLLSLTQVPTGCGLRIKRPRQLGLPWMLSTY